MKKFLMPILLSCTVIFLSGCGNKEEANLPEPAETSVVEEFQEIETPDDSIVKDSITEEPFEEISKENTEGESEISG